MDRETYLFVYGTLRSEMRDPLHHLLEKQAFLVGAGAFQGKLYDLGRYPGAVRSRGKNDRVFGEIYRLSEPQRAFKILDAYEGPSIQAQKADNSPSERRKYYRLDLSLHGVGHRSPAHCFGRLRAISKRVLAS
jgi:gamma-glutamylcyclotransferase (GGCT)/AIG2-like uncharacterized protein YtfP